MKTDRRKSERHPTRALMTGLCDGEVACIGIVQDVSAKGLMVSLVPSSFNESALCCLCTIYGPEQDLKIKTVAHWTKETNRGMYKTVGFGIERPSRLWKSFVAETSKLDSEGHDIPEPAGKGNNSRRQLLHA